VKHPELNKLQLKAVVVDSVAVVVVTIVVAEVAAVAAKAVVASAVPAKTSGFQRPNSAVSLSTDTSLPSRRSTLTPSQSRRLPLLIISSSFNRVNFLMKL
jgi:serine acetyltransferase